MDNTTTGFYNNLPEPIKEILINSIDEDSIKKIATAVQSKYTTIYSIDKEIESLKVKLEKMSTKKTFSLSLAKIPMYIAKIKALDIKRKLIQDNISYLDPSNRQQSYIKTYKGYIDSVYTEASNRGYKYAEWYKYLFMRFDDIMKKYGWYLRKPNYIKTIKGINDEDIPEEYPMNEGHETGRYVEEHIGYVLTKLVNNDLEFSDLKFKFEPRGRNTFPDFSVIINGKIKLEFEVKSTFKNEELKTGMSKKHIRKIQKTKGVYTKDSLLPVLIFEKVQIDNYRMYIDEYRWYPCSMLLKIQDSENSPYISEKSASDSAMDETKLYKVVLPFEIYVGQIKKSVIKGYKEK